MISKINCRDTLSKLLGLLLLIQLASCTVRKATFPMIFRSEGGFLHNDIIFQSDPNILIEYSSGAMLYVVSTWTIKGDTVIVIPKMEYGNRNGTFWYEPLAPGDSTVTSIPKKYILNDGRLIDITDYSSLFSSLGLNKNETQSGVVYYRFK